ncbi:hypothetical protein EDB89DRAFT_2166483, partial [Lactarius sanguifluus]
SSFVHRLSSVTLPFANDLTPVTRPAHHSPLDYFLSINPQPIFSRRKGSTVKFWILLYTDGSSDSNHNARVLTGRATNFVPTISRVTLQDVATFFGEPTLPQPSVHQVILDNKSYPPDGIADRGDRNFFFYLEAAMKISTADEPILDEFPACLLRLLGYDDIVADCYIYRQNDIPFFMCGGNTSATTDVCVRHRNTEIFLVVQVDKKFLEGVDPEPQLIAQAIAAFQYNNRLLLRIGKEPIRAKAIPGIVMLGTTPTFYKITVTQDLVDAVEASQYPQNTTTVHRLELPIDYPNGLDGMKDLDDRAVLLGCFEAFKQFVVD